jgi:hypothetical protein
LSINDDHSHTSCTFYVNSIQVKHSGESGREHRERESERERLQIGERGREGENGGDERENSMGFKRRSALVDFD